MSCLSFVAWAFLPTIECSENILFQLQAIVRGQECPRYMGLYEIRSVF